MTERLILVRHGQTAWNLEGRFQGQTDIPLNGLGLAQAAAMAPRVAALSPDALVSSDLGRALQTAQAIAAEAGLQIGADTRLREIHVGTWAGWRHEDALAELPDFGELLAQGEDFRRSATGETASEVADRVAPALNDIADRHRGETTAVVGHGLALRVAIARLLGWDDRVAASLAGLWNCSWTILDRRDSRWRLVSYNNTASDAPAA